jgi:UDP-GlcNAc:undecaprenyl-phosphate GlcNAc-1-phosphate transferase
MTPSIFAFTTALLASITLTPAARQLAFRSGIIDHPGSRRMPLLPTPLLGGIAIYAGAILAIVLVTVFWVPGYAWEQIFSILTGATLMVFAGIINDRGVFSFYNNLTIAIPIAAFILILSGIHTNVFQELFADQLTYPQALLADYVLTFAWIIGVTTAFTIIDHMDGLCAGISAIASAFFLLFAIIGNQVLVGTLAAATFGASLGFLYWNFNPVRIAMGRGGTMFLGFIIAVLALKIRFLETPAQTRWIIPLLILGFVFFDVVLVTTSHLRRKQFPFSVPGKDHVSHRLLQLGMDRMSAVIALYGLSTLFGMLALLVSQLTVWKSHLISSMTLLIALVAMIALEYALVRHERSLAHTPAQTANQTIVPTIKEPLLKRPLDLVLSSLMLLMALPVGLIIALAIKLEDGGPVFFRQERWGRGGTRFWVYKFRSMVPNADRYRQASENDSRITRVGRKLRAMGLDELPQLINIWKGEMSFVGPRALVVGEKVNGGAGNYRTYENTPGFWERLAVRPGLTSVATIYIPKDSPPQRKFRYDMFYIRHISFWLDIRMIALSYWISFRGKWETRKEKI